MLVVLEPLVSLHADLLEGLQHLRLSLWVAPLLALDGRMGEIESVGPPEAVIPVHV